MLIEDSYALLARLSHGGPRQTALVTDDDRFEASADVLADEGGMQMLGVSIRHDATYTRLILDWMGCVAAMAASDTRAAADALARGDLARKGIIVVHGQPLVADEARGPRRTSVLRWGDGLSVRVKRLDGEEDGCTWLQVRIFMDTSAGYVHPVLTGRGALVCVVSGRTDQDAWLRVQGELNRQGVEFS